MDAHYGVSRFVRINHPLKRHVMLPGYFRVGAAVIVAIHVRDNMIVPRQN